MALPGLSESLFYHAAVQVVALYAKQAATELQHNSNGASQDGDKSASQNGKQSGKSKGKAGKGRKGKSVDSQAGASTVSSGVKLEDVSSQKHMHGHYDQASAFRALCHSCHTIAALNKQC